MKLSKEDAANILDALNEWDETIGPKEIDDVSPNLCKEFGIKLFQLR